MVRALRYVRRMTRSILLVDDEEPILLALSEFFTAEGWNVVAARELEEAEALLATQEFAAAIADLRLTGYGRADGLKIAETIHARYPRTRVILLTGYRSAEVETNARAFGVDCILHKPQPLSFIADIVTHLVERAGAGA
jgi:DNA-binding NtrC family response regulator